MRVVVDIPNWLYNAMLEHKEPIYSQSLGEAVRDGTPLPKGHGRLIDADDYKKNVCTYQQTGCGDCKHSLCCPEDAPTIIEADKAKSEVSE